jgi:1-acyl-sn-glycerol-3-phosphate acyltransferase
MYPPFFHDPGRRRFDAWSLHELADLCREGRGRLVGFHPEGRRNLDPDPSTLLPPQAGIGRLIHAANPQVVPVFISGLGNSLPELFALRWKDGERIRIAFGPALDCSDLVALPAEATTYRAIAERAMAGIKNQQGILAQSRGIAEK